jgi:geranylgeranyl reductase family protein
MVYDVIIVGAGPAGSTCAQDCAAQGLRTLLLDRDRFPRQKPCGGAVSEEALSLLDRPLPPDIVGQECFGARIHFGGRSTEVTKGRRIAVLVDRARFDQHLADRACKAGAEFRQGESATRIELGTHSAVVMTSSGRYEGRFIVGADGANSIIGRKLRPPFGRDESMVALVGNAVIRGSKEVPRPSNLLEMHFGIAPMGYGWVFRRNGIASVGVMGLASRFPRAQACLADYRGSLGLEVEGIRGHTIPMGGFRRRISAGRILLAGDAAGFADPFHGEGIMQAIRSGRLAAHAVAEGIAGRADAAEWYGRECERVIVGEMQVALMMARMLERYPGIFVEIFLSGGPALERYLDIAAGRNSYRSFRRWLLPRLPAYLMRKQLRQLFGRGGK